MTINRLCDLIGVSGYESEVVKCIYNELKIDKHYKLNIDNVGNLVCLKQGKESNKKIILVAHVDEVGFQVIKKVDNGKYKIKSLGSIKTWNAFNQRVKSQKSYGIIRCANEDNLFKNNYNDLYIEQIDGKGDIEVGEVFSFENNFYETNDKFLGKALDNRISCFCLLELIKMNIQTNDDVYYCFSVQEEIGMRGNRVLKSSIQPDLCITLDVSAINEMNSLDVNKGVAIKISDSMSVSNPYLVRWACDIAKKNNISYQMEVSDCGTSEMIISNELDNGCVELGISIPCKNIHTCNSVIYKEDIKATIKLMGEILKDI